MSPEPGVDYDGAARLLLMRPGHLVLKLWVTAAFRQLVSCASLPRFSNTFQDHMVLQRGNPIIVWGVGATWGRNLTVELTSDTGEPLLSGETAPSQNGAWSVTLQTPPANATGQSMQLALTVQGSTSPSQVLEDVTVGDVFLFTGQSNVDLPQSYAHQNNLTAQEEEEAFATNKGAKGLIRIMIVPNQMPELNYGEEPVSEIVNVSDCEPCPFPFDSNRTQYLVCHCNSLRWTRASAAGIRGFSALAWFTGAALARTVDALSEVPLGLVRSSWGGTKILRWSGPDAIAKCPQSGKPHGRGLPSDLFSNMVYPLRSLRFSAVVWMHGASDTGKIAPFLGPSYYACALPAMIVDWREKFKDLSLPFIVVELPAYCNERDWATFHTFCDQKRSILRSRDYHLPSMRAAQAAAEKLPDVYMVTSMDLGSLHPLGGSIHSDRKAELGHRVGLAARAAVYNDTSVLWSAPTGASATQLDAQHVTVHFATQDNESIVLNASLRCPPDVLDLYCTGAGFELRSGDVWVPVSDVSLGEERSVIITLPTSATSFDRVRYAYADWPVCSVRGAESSLPARTFDLPVFDAMGSSNIWLEKNLGPLDVKIPLSVRREVETSVRGNGFDGFSWPFIAFVSVLLVSLVFCIVRACMACVTRNSDKSQRVLEADPMQKDTLLGVGKGRDYAASFLHAVE